MKQLNKGFTIIELLIVIAIIGILATTVVPKLIKEIRKATVATVRHDLGAIRSRLSLDEIADQYPDLANTEINSSLLNSYSIEPTPAFTGEDGIGHNKSSQILIARDNSGGWVYDREKGEIYANLPNGAYTKDKEYEIWNGEGDEQLIFTDPVGGDWDKFIKGAIKEGTSPYGEITFNFPDEFTIAPQEWHGNNQKYWEKVFIYDENKTLIKNSDSKDGSYNYKEAITVNREKDHKYIAILEKIDPSTGEKIYLYCDSKASGW